MKRKTNVGMFRDVASSLLIIFLSIASGETVTGLQTFLSPNMKADSLSISFSDLITGL